MKTYTINNVSVSEEDLKKIIRENPSLLETKKEGRYFKPEVGERYFFIDSVIGIDNHINDDDTIDRYLISRGNCYRTKEDAELALAKEQALVRLWNWAEENAPFESNWSNTTAKYCTYYDQDAKKFKLMSAFFLQYQFTLPYFSTKEDCEKFNEVNLVDLQLLWGVK